MSGLRMTSILFCLMGLLVGLHACTTPDGALRGTDVVGGDPFTRFQADGKTEQGKSATLQEGGTTIRVAAIPSETRLLAVYAAGQDRPHTVRVDTNLLDLRDRAALADSLAMIADVVEPNDEQALEWMLNAYGLAWAQHGIVADSANRSMEDVIIEWWHRGLSYSAFGVPPDIATIIVTSRDACRPRNQVDHLYRDWHRHCH